MDTPKTHADCPGSGSGWDGLGREGGREGGNGTTCIAHICRRSANYAFSFASSTFVSFEIPIAQWTTGLEAGVLGVGGKSLFIRRAKAINFDEGVG